MILPLIALAAFRLGACNSSLITQTNPPGVPVLPSQAAFFSASGATAVVEVRNGLGLVVPFVDSIGVIRSHVTVTIPASTAVGLGWELTQTAPDGTHYLVPLASSQYSLIVRMTSGDATESPVGTYDSSAGAGNGIAVGFVAPDAGTPTVLASQGLYTISPGMFVVSGGSGGTTILPTQGVPSQTNPTITSGSSVTLLAANPGRKYLKIINNSGGPIMISLSGGTLSSVVPSNSNPGDLLAPNGGGWENPAHYCPTGAITVYQSSGVSISSISVTEGS